MRALGLAVVAAAALGACNPSAPAGGGGSVTSVVFPDLNRASYRAEATMIAPDGSTSPLVMIRDGAKVRMEMGDQIIITDPVAGETFVIHSQGGQQMAMRMDASDVPDMNQVWAEAQAEVTQTGPCTVGGESGVQWSHTLDGGTAADTACVTSDGIILSATDDGRESWRTTSIQRGPQDPALFTVPAGVTVMDLGNLQNQAADAVAKMKAAQDR